MQKNILIIAPPYFSIPTIGYGSISTVVNELVKGLLIENQKVFLFAPGSRDLRKYLGKYVDSKLLDNLKVFRVPGMELGLNEIGASDEDERRKKYIDHIITISKEIKPDIIHTHNTNERLFEYFSSIGIPIVHTIHIIRDEQTKNQVSIFLKYKKYIHFVGVSKSHTEQYPEITPMGFVYNGEDPRLFIKSDRGENPGPGGIKNYILFLGVLSKQKGVKTCVEASLKAGKNVAVIGGPCKFKPDLEYIAEIKDYAKRFSNRVFFVGEKNAIEKTEYLSHAQGLIFAGGVEDPKWSEPFGLVIIEALHSGVPVIAVSNGAIPEIVVDKITGYVVDLYATQRGDLDGLVESIKNLDKINASACLTQAKERFSHRTMARGYIQIYNQLSSKINKSLISQLFSST